MTLGGMKVRGSVSLTPSTLTAFNNVST